MTRATKLLGALTMLALGACSSDGDPVCTPGATQACVCPGGGAGAQACEKDGKSWGVCYGCPGDSDAGVDRGPARDVTTDRPPASGCTKASDLLNPDACGPGKACAIVDGGGALGCATPGSTAFHQPCTNQGECAAGSGCLGLSAGALTCLPFCDRGGADTCPKGSVCNGTFHTAAGDIGLCMLAATCDLVTGGGCHSGQGCYVGDAKGNPVCVTAGKTAEGGSCATSDQCLPGLVCSKSVCRKLCHDSGVCTSPATCKGVGLVFSAAPTVGICLPP
jgi:hypothetical protein